MIIHDLRLTNFGIFGDDHYFDLKPVAAKNYSRPIVLLRGKNGVGKTTFVEAIRLCLHGQASIGARIGQQEYDDYLMSRIHRPANGDNSPDHAKIELVFDYASQGERHLYRVIRSWKLKNERIHKNLSLWEDRKLLQGTNNQKEETLRELVPPGVADLFFFDGEKIRTFADDKTGNEFLADTVKSLFGLNMVEQLSKDLDIFIARQQTENGRGGPPSEIEESRTQESALENRRAEIQVQQQKNGSSIIEINQKIEIQKQKIAAEGGSFAEQREELQARLERVEAKIELQRRRAQELAGDLMPFAIAPDSLVAIANQLEDEQRYEEWQTANRIFAEQLDQLQKDMNLPNFWEASLRDLSNPKKTAIYEKIRLSLSQTIPEKPIEDTDVILHVSGKKRETLSNWIVQARDSIPRQFCVVTQYLDDIERERSDIRADLNKVPAEETLKPLVENLLELLRALTLLEKDRDRLADEARIVAFHLERVESRLRNLHEQMAEYSASDERMGLAARTQLALEAFEERVSIEKVGLLEREIVRRFNQLVRKESFLEAVTLDPKYFTITLFRNGQVFPRSELSAGERQLLAVATMWALLEVSGRPVPVIIDTPLSRLDSEHRLSMIQDYFPRVSHQVIILATDAEIDHDLELKLRPAISHIFELEDNDTGSVEVKLDRIMTASDDLITAEQIPIL